MNGLDLGHTLLTIARSAIAEKFGLPLLEEGTHAALQQPSATL